MANNLNLKAPLLFLAGLVLLSSCKNHETIAPSPLPACGQAVLSGYTNNTSYFPGDEMAVYLQSTKSLSCGLNIYDINGRVAFTSNTTLFPQVIGNDHPWQAGFDYAVSGKIKIPSTLASGVYLIENQVAFIVKSSGAETITVVYPSNTINAYDGQGGKSLYNFNSSDNKPSPIVSFHRPVDNPEEQVDFCTGCFKWIPTLNLKINYVADIDLEEPSSFSQSKLLVIAGHSEYWTRKARLNFDRFVNAGGHVLILSGNSMWWQVRYPPTKDALICYRSAQLDPESDVTLKTVNWTDPTLQLDIVSSIGADFNHGGFGLQTDNGWDGFKIRNPASPLLAGLNLKKGDIVSLPSGEYDGAPLAGFDADGFPILDNNSLKFEKAELIGFDKGTRGGQETIATFIVFQKSKTSGVIVNTGANGWCSLSAGIGSASAGPRLQVITRNAINRLLKGESCFSQ